MLVLGINFVFPVASPVRVAQKLEHDVALFESRTAGSLIVLVKSTGVDIYL